jgi:hypothetical protein
MPEQTEQTKSEPTQAADTSGSTSGSTAGSTALKTAAAAAGAAAMIARKAFSGSGSSNGAARENGSSGERGSSGGSKSSALTAIASGGWDAARDALVPAAEDAAAAMGTFVGQNAPELVRDRIVPRFIESFNEARGGD